MEEFKPCPFCGGEAGLFAYKTFVDCAVRCKSCYNGTDEYRNKEDAIEAWNRRVE